MPPIHRICPHPRACWASDEDGHQWCRWCEEVDELRREAKSLIAQLRKQAIILGPGGHVLKTAEIGYLVMEAGSTLYTSASSELEVADCDHKTEAKR